MEFQNGKIYTIRSFQTDKYYIGSTNQLTLAQRLGKHRSNYKDYLKGAEYKLYMTSYEILQYDDNYIELLELYPCNSKDELHKREGQLQRQHISEIVNHCIAGRSSKEYAEENSVRLKQIREQNKEFINEQHKQYYNNNKEIIAVKAKQYRQDNKEIIAEHSKQYRQDNKEILKQYYYNNKETIAVYKKKHYEEHREEIAEYKKKYQQDKKEILAEHAKQYRKDNKEILNEKHKQYYNDNKQTILEMNKATYLCECGKTSTITHKTRHIKTPKHLKLMDKLYLDELTFYSF